MKKRGLGKGLAALIDNNIDENITITNNNPIFLSLAEIKPNKNQPRKIFDKQKLEELSQSIKEHGLIQPIIVKKMSTYYQIIAGERRYKASKMAGLEKIPVIIKDYDPKKILEIALIENIQRENLNPIEEANCYDKLINTLKITQEKLANKLGKSRSSITNTLRLLKLTKEIQDLIIENKLSQGHARCLITIDDFEKQNFIAKQIIKYNYSVRETENYIKNLNNNKPQKSKTKQNKFSSFEDNFKDTLGTKVNIKNGKKKGKIEIEYYSEEDFERIYNLICK